MHSEPAERAEAGTSGNRQADPMDQRPGDAKPAVKPMGMSVALDGDARQAAAARIAEEQALVRNAQAGDRLAFEELVHRYDREVLRLALNLVHRAEDARDIYQESFMRVYKNLHRFRFECSFYTWLYRIVTNVALDHLRRRTSRREDQAPVPDEAEGGTRDFFDRQPEVRAAANPERSLLGQELGPAHFRSAEEAVTARAHGFRDEALSGLETEGDWRHARHLGRNGKEFAVPGDAEITRKPGLHAVTSKTDWMERMRQEDNNEILNSEACEEFDSRLMLLAAGELTPDEEADVADHLKHCARCMEALERERELVECFAASRIEPDAALLASCRSSLEDALDRQEERSWLRRITNVFLPAGGLSPRPAWSAALLVLVGFSVGILGPRFLQRTIACFR